MMALNRTPTENLALKLLALGGIAAIWQLHIAAAQAHRKGCPRAPRWFRRLRKPQKRHGCGPRASARWSRGEAIGPRDDVCPSGAPAQGRSNHRKLRFIYNLETSGSVV